MDIICISTRTELTNALQAQKPLRVQLHVVDSFLSCMESLNDKNPKAIIIDMADSNIMDYDMIEMFPPENSPEYIPLISVAMDSGAGAIGDSVNNESDINAVAQQVMGYVKCLLF